MPRSLMNAAVVFGDVAVAVKLHTATTSERVHFHEVHAKDGARIEHRRFCTEEDKEVPYEEVVRGHEIRDGEYAVLTPEQLAAATPDGDRTIRIEAFVPAADIDPILRDKAYHLGAGDDAGAAYRLLHDALVKTGRAGIAFFVFHDRERLAAVLPHDGVLVLQTLRPADTVVDLDELRPDEGKDAPRAPTAKERKMAGQLIDALHEPFRPEDHEDEHRALVMKLIEAKAAGEEIEVPEAEDVETPDDLAAALEASLADRGHGGRRRRAAPKAAAKPSGSGRRSPARAKRKTPAKTKTKKKQG
ncbi:Ku protein [Paraconexibacter antarcticus]|uniref:Non-homologous end joining protein Ku n=1 Tax=Paraconexibacter antarcticus TaxID=2949664 RepID=A0ABY5DYR7_9ACTN|nr:Ku protein [Paraconexibacter antarcticus]UTI66089.1 Ku protein [Paraconexibacter antarcticus]